MFEKKKNKLVSLTDNINNYLKRHLEHTFTVTNIFLHLLNQYEISPIWKISG